MSKQKFFSNTEILKKNAQWNILFGERSNGKSYGTKNPCIENAIKFDKELENNPLIMNEERTEKSFRKFILVRRWENDMKNGYVEDYFKDSPISIMTQNESTFVTSYRGKIYLSHLDENNKIVRDRHVGYMLALSQEQKYKSRNFQDVTDIIFEEFISSDYYLPNEVTKLESLVSTIARKEFVRVWLIGNTISRHCPYFREWELIRIPKQEQGTIDVYERKNLDGDLIKIAVQYCETSGKSGKMFGFSKKQNMTTSGSWQSEPQPHLECKLNFCTLLYTIVVQKNGYKFLCKFMKTPKNNYVWYVEPKTTPIQENTRLISDIVIESNLSTVDFTPLNKNEAIAFSFFNDSNTFFSDNLTGTEFKQILREIKKG